MPRQKSPLRTIAEPLAAAVVLAVIARGVLEIYSIPSASMAPTLRAGDRILATRYLFGSPKRGDVVVFESPDGSGELLVKRLIGVPGDLIDSRLGRVRIGAHTLPEPYILEPAASGAIQSQLVPPSAYFVLGDNRSDSRDSRSWGAVPSHRIVGRARLVLWTSGAASDDSVRASAASIPSREPANASRPAGLRLFKWIE